MRTIGTIDALRQLNGVTPPDMLRRVRIIKRDATGDTEKYFCHDRSYELLKIGEAVELQNDKGEISNYCVQSAQWEFSHFGDTYVIVVIPKTS